MLVLYTASLIFEVGRILFFLSDEQELFLPRVHTASTANYRTLFSKDGYIEKKVLLRIFFNLYI